MKKLAKIITLLFIAVFATGCATGGYNPEASAAARTAKNVPFYERYDNTVNGAVVGGATGLALQKLGIKHGGAAGLLLGVARGAAEDHREAKDNERAEKIGELINNKTGGGDSAAAEARLRAQANLTFAEKKRRECEAEYGTYAEAGVRWPHDCRIAFQQALADAKYVSETNSPEVFHQTMRGGYLYDGIRPGSPHERYWRYWRRQDAYQYQYRYPRY